MVGQVRVGTVCLEVEHGSGVAAAADLMDRHVIKISAERNAQVMTGGKLPRRKKARFVNPRPFGNQDGVLWCGLERNQRERRDANELALVVMPKDPAHLVLASVAARRGEPVRRQAAARIAIRIIARLVPEFR